MTDLQIIELDMLKVVIRICEELHLRYYLVCGSVLGAVKYSGFIPWDDDVDVGLFREDYDIFISKAQSMLPKHLFLQNHKTDPRYPHLFSKIRNCETTYIEKGLAGLDINHGVYIDVFPLDGYPTCEAEQERLEAQKITYQKKLSCVFRMPRNLKAKLGMRLRRMRGYHRQTAQILDAYIAEISQYAMQDTLLICNHGNWQGKLEYAPREQYGNGTWAEFEGLKVRIPERYDEYLTQKYGDWRADLPQEQQIGHHYAEIIDLERPYTDYIEYSKNGRIRIKSKTVKK